MGNVASVDPRHARIWQNLATLQSNQTRMQMLDTLMVGGEYVNAAKRAGIYANVLQWIAAYRRGESPQWPWATVLQQPQQHYSQQFTPAPSRSQVPQQAPQQSTYPTPHAQTGPRTISHVMQPQYQHAPHASHAPHTMPNIQMPIMNEPRKVVKENTLATVPPPKRALDTLHESYRILKIDDTRPLTHESLRLAYKKAAAKAHPDRGGSAEEFDEVTRAFLYLEEVIHKLIPKGATDGEDPRFKQAVTKEAAIKAREGPLTKYDADEAAHRMREHASAASAASREEPKIALNPKNLNMSVFNKLFEENRLPDPDQDGYGDWLKSSGEDRRLQNESQLRSKFNADVFNKTFAEQGITRGDVGNGGLTKYQAPDAITHHGGTELGAGRPSHYISPLGAKTGYTDLKFAYGEGSTFSQDVVGIKEEKRNLDAMKRERESAPTPLTAEEQRMLDAIDRQKAAAEEERRRRLAVHDVAAEDVYAKMQRRLMIN